MTDEQKPLSFIISQEELVLLLRIMGATIIPGMGLEPLEGLDEEQILLVMSTAERSLIAREILTINPDDSLGIDRAALALVGPCVVPDRSIILSILEIDAIPKPIYYHTSQQMIIEHSLIGEGLHRFAVLTGEAMLLQRIISHMQIGEQTKVTEKTSVLTLEELREILTLIRQNGSADRPPLHVNMEVENLSELVDAGMKDAAFSANLFFIDHLDQENNPSPNNMALFIGPNSIWEFDNGNLPDPENQVRIRSIDADSVRGKIDDVLAAGLG